MRDRETIDSELRLIALRRRSIGEQGGQPSCRQVDELLDERLGHRAAASHPEGLTPRDTRVVVHGSAQWDHTGGITPRRRQGGRRRLARLAALPLSLLAVAAAFVVMFGAHDPPPSEPAAVPPPSSAPAAPHAPQAPAPPLGIVDRAFIDALTKEGVPVPSHEYVTDHGHAVCDFLTHQHNLAEAVDFVQRSSIWDAGQSANFTAGAVVSYCPQYELAAPEAMQPGLQNAGSDLQTIQDKLQRIEGDLQGIQGDLPAIGGRQ